MSFLIPNAGDTTSGNKFEAIDQAEPDGLDLEILGNAGSGVLSGCAVSSNSSATTVAVSAGVVVLNGVPYAVSANATLGLPTAPADNRFDLVVARVSAGVASLVVVQGVNSATNPQFPQSASVLTGTPSPTTNVDLSTDVVLGALYRSGSSTVTSSRIVDKRRMVTTSIFDQGTAAPDTGYGNGTGSLFFNSAATGGTGSGVYIKGSTGAWNELALNAGAHLPIGAAVVWPTSADIPTGCVEANGQSLSTSAYPALFSVYGYLHGGAGGSFNVPDYNGKFIRGTTNTALVGTTVGSDSVTLTSSHLPAHTHGMEHTHRYSHTHGIDHTHGAFTSSSSGSHTHTVSGTTGAGSAHSHQMAAGFPVIAQVFSSPNRYIVTTATATGTEIIWQATYYTSGSESAHTHAFSATTDSAAAHTHSTTVSAYTGSTSSQSATTTTSLSSSTTDSAGSGMGFSNIPASAYARWIIRASLGSDPSFTGGSPTDVINKFSQSVEFTSPASATTSYLWVAAFPCTISTVRGVRTGGSGATVNVKVDGSYALSSDLSLTVSGTWTSAPGDAAVTVAEGDLVQVEVVTAVGSPTEVIVQVDYSV